MGNLWVLLALPNGARHVKLTQSENSGHLEPKTPKNWQQVANICLKMVISLLKKQFNWVK